MMTFTLTLHENGTWQIQPENSPKPSENSPPSYAELVAFFFSRQKRHGAVGGQQRVSMQANAVLEYLNAQRG